MLGRRAAAAIVAALLIVAPARAALEPIEIHVIFATTGGSGFIGREGLRTLAIAEDTINRSGGISGRPITFLVADSQSKAQVAVQLVSALLAKGMQVVLGPSPVSACAAVAPLMRDKAVMFCISAAYHPPPHSNLSGDLDESFVNG